MKKIKNEKVIEILKKSKNILSVIIGILTIIFAHSLIGIIPIILGSFSILRGAIGLFINIKEKEYATLETHKIPINIISIILGIMILVNDHNAIPFIAIVWGVSGLRSAGNGLNISLYNKSQGQKYIPELIHSIIEIALCTLLIFNPFEKIEEHLIILGIQMIVNVIKIGVKDKKYISAVE